MEAYAAALNFAIPFFAILIFIEYGIGLLMGKKTIRSMDTISSLSSGFTNTIKDVLGLSVTIISYKYLVEYLTVVQIEVTWMHYIIAFVGLDFAGYWSHRFNHKVNVFWNRHIVHHSSEEFNLACALRQSISSIFGIFFFLYIPMAMMGVPVKVVGIVAPIHLFAQFWYHTTLIKRMGFLEYVIVTPSHHRVHHAINDEYIDKNFAQIFIIWDKMFGTFQEEMDDVPAVYGVKKPVNTWNPYWINFMHMWQLAKDSFRTKKLWDKIRIWFMPTGWRPKDVREKYPIEITKDPFTRNKYDTKASVSFQAWHWFQLVLTLLLMLFIFNQIAAFLFFDILLYCALLGLSIFSYTTLMDRNPHAVWLEGLKMIFGFMLIFKIGSWYNIDNYIPLGTYLIGTYFVVSFLVTLSYVFFDIRINDKKIALKLN